MGAKSTSYLNVAGTPGEDLTISDWMSRLDDKTTLTGLSIPGTHRSASVNISRIWQCQSWDTDEALKFGIRFFDIHLSQSGRSTLFLCHGNQNFGDLRSFLTPVVNFLREHWSETILCRITEDYRVAGLGSFFAETFELVTNDAVPDNFLWKNRELPETIGAARGKIIFLRDFSDPYEAFVPYNIAVVRNHIGKPSFVAPYWNVLEDELNEARLGRNEFLYITYTGREDCLLYPRDYADWINCYLYEFLEKNLGMHRWGVIAMDFPGEKLIKMIVDSNFRDATDLENLTNLDKVRKISNS